MRSELHLLLAALLACTPAACARAGEALPFGASSADCATCHTEQGEAFARSAHARSDRSPVLAALLPRVADAWGTEARARCERCHAPRHVPGDAALPEASVSCISCHAAVGNRGERDGLLLVDARVPLGGPFADPEPSPAHASRQAPLVSSPSLCGTCHELTGPSLFVEETLTEHRAAAPSPDDPSCLSCHLPARAPGLAALGASRERPLRDHGFVGIDPPWGASPEEARRASLASAELVAQALSLALHEGEGEGVVEVRLTNVGARHAVPTGVAFLRDVWVDLELTHADGSTRALSRVIELGDRPMRGEEPVALPTDADRIEVRRLGYLEERVAQVAVSPEVVHVRATLRARAFRADVLDALGLAARAAEVPVLEARAVDLER